jgi:hypothetical protein
MRPHPPKVQGKWKRVDITQREKTKANNQRKIRKKNPYANRTQGYKTMINDNKEDLRRENNCLRKVG